MRAPIVPKTQHSAKFKNITVPVLSAANWGGTGMHPRGNYEGYLGASSSQKWLSVHGDTHFGPFYRTSGVDMQKMFLAHFLKGKNNGWDKQPPVLLDIRRPGEHFTTRAEREWPLARTEWTKFYLDPTDMSLRKTPKQAAPVKYNPIGNGLFYYLPTSEKEVEITGPIVARLWVSSETTDADLFLVLRLYDPDGQEVLFVGSNDPRMPITFGWLRASHRKLDQQKSLPHRPYQPRQPPVFGVAMLSPLLGPTTIGAVGLVSLAMNLAVPVGITLLEIDRAKKASADGTKAASESSTNPIKTGVLLGLRSPLLWAPVLGAAVALSGIHLPETLNNSLNVLGSATAGVAVFAVGISLAAHPLSLSKAVMWGSVSRITLQAGCLFLLAELLHVNGPIYRESLICCTLPPAATVNLLAMTYNSAQTETASILSFTTLLLIITIPLALYVTHHV